MDNSLTRYQRQTVLPEIGLAGQARLAAARVLCVGAGGLGCPALMYLAAAGIGHITIIDPDCVEMSNLQRQVLFTSAECGMPKAAAARIRLLAMNPDISITAITDELDALNAEALFRDHNIILDGTDNFAAKFLINDAGVKTGKPVVYGAIQGFDGQVAVFDAAHGPCYRCLHPSPPQAMIRNCAEAGVIGALAGIIGTMQAMEVIKLIVGGPHFTPLAGRLLLLDARTMETRTLTIPKNPSCAVCAARPQDIHLHYASQACAVVSQITPQEARTKKFVLLVDVREQNEWEAGHISNAKLVPLSSLTRGDAPDLPHDRDIALYCQKGKRSLEAARILGTLGYTRLSSIAGGYDAWLTVA